MSMGPLDALWHLLNFVAPAAWVALAVSAMGRFFKQKRPLALGFLASIAIHFVVCLIILVIGLMLTGRDGKMLTYLAMVLGSTAVQVVLSGAWRR